jgi:hypothetical protein
VRDREGPIEAHRDGPDLLALRRQVPDRFGSRLRAGPHEDDDALGVGRAGIVEEAVAATGPRRERRHRVRDDRRTGTVERVHRLATLEVHVGVLRRAADRRVLGRERARPAGAHELVVDERAHVVVGERHDLRHLVRGAKAVEEVKERHARRERRGVGHERHVHGFLDRARGQHREPGRARRHDVAVVAEDRQTLGRECAGGDVNDRRRQLSGDLVHVRDHEEQALRRRERRRERAAEERPVDRARRAALALHLDDARRESPEVRAALARPSVGELPHRRRRRDRVDGDHLRREIRDLRRRLVAVDRRRGHVAISRRGAVDRAALAKRARLTNGNGRRFVRSEGNVRLQWAHVPRMPRRLRRPRHSARAT